MGIPTDFSHRPVDLVPVDASQLMRIFKTPAGRTHQPIYYGSNGRNRFDCPANSFGVMYAAFDYVTCFAEAITREKNLAPLKHGGLELSKAAHIADHHVVTLQADLPLRLIDATDLGLYRMGAEAGEFNSPPTSYALTTQLWSRELFNRPEVADGILYRSRFLNNRQAVALFERGGARARVMPLKIDPLDRHPDYLKAIRDLRILLLP